MRFFRTAAHRSNGAASPDEAAFVLVVLTAAILAACTGCGNQEAVSLFAACAGCGNQGAVSLSANSYDFGEVALPFHAQRAAVTVTNQGNSPVNLSSALEGDSSFSIVGDMSCGSSLAAGQSCVMVLGYAPAEAGTSTASLVITAGPATGPVQQAVAVSGTAVSLSPGESFVAETANPLVALYTTDLPAPGKVSVEFGKDTSYGRQTWAVGSPNGGPVEIFVAGMEPGTTYHMRAVATLTDGSVIDDQDQTFTTGSFPANSLPKIVVDTGGTPQSGVELLDGIPHSPTLMQAMATDLAGNVIWGYDYGDRQTSSIIDPIKLLPNGDFVLVISNPSQNLVQTPPPAGTLNVIREIDLAGDPIRQITMDQLNAELAAAGYNLPLGYFHHDIAILPNGHLIVIANTVKSVSGLSGEPNPVNVVGDVLVDLDQNLKPVWVWNEFDHLDVNRHPMSFPDWTHTNAVLYSPDDGNLLVSIRHQSWIVKVDYANGAGSGNILWKLGQGGDFTLVNGNDPVDWFYAQHGPSFLTANTAGNFSLALMDNGDNRILSSSSSAVCGSGTNCYSTVPILAINEQARTATLTFHDIFPASQYSFWGGGTTPLANGNLEFDLCAEPNTTSDVYEVTPGGSAQTVWHLNITGENLYRANRLPSLYPGVQW